MRPGAPRSSLLALVVAGSFGCALAEAPEPIEIPATSGKADGVRGPWLLETHPGGDSVDVTGRDHAGAILAQVSLRAPSDEAPARLEIIAGGAPIATELSAAGDPLPPELPQLSPRENRLLLAMGQDLERWYRDQGEDLARGSMALTSAEEEPAEPNECIPDWLRPAVPETCGSLLAVWGGLYAIGSLALLHPAGRILGWGARLLGTSGRIAAWLQALVPGKLAAAAGTTAIPYYLSMMKLAWEGCHERPADAPIDWCPANGDTGGGAR